MIMEMWILWLIFAGVLLIIEVLTQMLWGLCLAVGCIGGLVASLCGVSPIWQIISACVLATCAYIFLVPLFSRWHALSVDKKGREARTGMDALLGRHAVLSQEITADRPGRGRIDGDNWQMVAEKPYTTLRRGTEVVVTAYDSIILTVKPINEI